MTALASPEEIAESPAQLLARRFPLLLQDLSAWTRAHPHVTQFSTTPAPLQPIAAWFFTQFVLMHCLDPQVVAGQLDTLQPGHTLVHCFSDAAGFLRFLSHPQSGQVMQRENWQPILLLPLAHSRHTQAWLSSIPATRWPWPLCDQLADAKNPNDPAKKLGEEMVALVRQTNSDLARRLHEHYADRPAPADVLAAGERPLRAIVLAYRGSVYQQFCARDICDGLTASGLHARLLLPSMNPARDLELLQAIEDFDPDVLVLNGRCRGDFNNLLPDNLTVLSWDQDYLIAPRTTLTQLMGPRDRLMVMIADWQEDAKSNGLSADRISHVNNGSNTEIYFPADRDARPQPKYDVLFVGNIHPFETYKKIIDFDNLSPNLQQVMLASRDRLAEWVATREDGEPFILPDLDVFLRQTLAKIDLAYRGDARDWRHTVNYFRYRIAHYVVREAFVSALAEFKLGLFGRGWQHFPAVAKFAQDELANGAPLREAMHQSAVMLHVHSWSVQHPRVYDATATGGFVLVGRVQEKQPLEASFDVGRELEAFGSIAEMKRKIRHYLAHPAERQAIADRGLARALRDHSMHARMRQARDILAGVHA